MHRAPHCQAILPGETCGAAWPPSAATLAGRMPIPICGVALSLIAACVSCRNDPADLPGNPQVPNLTTRGPANGSDNEPDEMNPNCTESVDGNPFGGCVMCHIDVEDEFEGSIHQTEQIGCVQCHGPSVGHVADENNEVRPDQVFARKDIDRLCGQCHACSRLMAAPPAELPAHRRVCSECHDAHSLVLAVGGEEW
jgi:hypothetical protein